MSEQAAPMIRIPGGGIRADLITEVEARAERVFAPGRERWSVWVNGDPRAMMCEDEAKAEVERILAERDMWAGSIDPAAVRGLEAALAEANSRAETYGNAIIGLTDAIMHAPLLIDLVTEAVTIEHETGEIVATPRGTVVDVKAALAALDKFARGVRLITGDQP